MQTDSSGVASSASGVDGHDVAVQELEDWAATMALMVAGTLEPSCALAFCFGNPDLSVNAARRTDRPSLESVTEARTNCVTRQ